MTSVASRKDYRTKTRRRRSAYGISGASDETFGVHLSPRIAVIVDPKKKLTAGCYVLVSDSSKAGKLGRYWPGSPAKFTQDVRPVDDLLTTREGEEILRPRRSLPKSAAVYRVIGMQRFYPVAPIKN